MMASEKSSTVHMVVLLIVTSIISSASSDDPVCADKCTCYYSNVYQLKTDCRWKSLSRVPKILDKRTQLLDLSHNKIGSDTSKDLSEIFHHVRSLSHLSYLDLSYNQIKQLPTNAFVNNRHLSVLNLKSNPLVITTGAPLLNAVSLIRLDISYCNLTYLNHEALFMMPFLWELNLSGNKLRSIDVEVFQPLRSLLRLELSDNPFKCDCALQRLYDFTSDNSLYTGRTPILCLNWASNFYSWTEVDLLKCEGRKRSEPNRNSNFYP